MEYRMFRFIASRKPNERNLYFSVIIKISLRMNLFEYRNLGNNKREIFGKV